MKKYTFYKYVIKSRQFVTSGMIWLHPVSLFVGIVFIALLSCSEGQKKPALPAQPAKISSVDLSFLAQQDGAFILPWKYLLRLKMDSVYNNQLGMVVEMPVFNDTLKALEGKQVVVEGFYIPATETKDNQVVILSAYPFAQCFYCGKAGIESVIDVLSVEPLPRMKTDTKTHIRGRFKLNADNFDYLVYVLEESVLVEN